MRERTTLIMDELDQPTISTARLEQMFGGVREELTTALRLPPAEQLVRRARRRRRLRRAGVSMVTGAVTCGLLLGWSLFSGGPGDDGVSVSGAGPDRTFSPVLELPGPISPPSTSPGATAQAATGGLLGQEGFGLLLPTERLPEVPGLYGPWVRQTENPTAVTDPAGLPSQAASQAPVSLAEGCASALVQQAGGLRHWEFDYADTAGHRAFARQYVVEFDSAEAAAGSAVRIHTAGVCTSDRSGWTLEDQAPAEVAVRLPGDRPLVEEIGAQVIGRWVVVLTVERRADGATAEVGVEGAFRRAVQALADQAEASPSPAPSRPLRSAPVPSAPPTGGHS